MTRSHGRLRGARVLWLGIALLLGACTTMAPQPEPAAQRIDPWENWNRKVFAFNEGLDRAFLKPAATAYVEIVPSPLRKGVDNFFANFADAWSAVNNVLQGKGQPAFEDVVRVGTNTFLGLGGVLDIASEFGLEHHYEDFGRTLGHWGVGTGPYMVLPLFGPSSVRDTAALPLDWSVSPAALLVDDDGARLGIGVLQVINARANLLNASRLLEGIALDKYTFLRDAYLQRRGSLRFDDNAPDDAADLYAPPSDEVAPSAAPPASAPTAR